MFDKIQHSNRGLIRIGLTRCLLGGGSVEIAEQHLVLRLWRDYLGDRTPSNSIVREFYLDVIKPSDLYHYGVAYEVFDVLTNGVFDLRVADSWNGRGPLEAKEAKRKAGKPVHIPSKPVAAA